MKKVMITGSSGMVGKGVLLECLDHPQIDHVLIINRKSIHLSHPKLEEILLDNFLNISSIQDRLAGYDACFHCMGISAVGLSEEQYTEITYTITKAFVDILYDLNKKMVFVYVSGQGTDDTEKGLIMWARVKGRTENMIFSKGFYDAYAFRPGFILPEKGITSRTRLYNTIYKIAKPFFPLLRKSKNVTTTTKLGLAMIATLTHPLSKKILDNRDINQLAASVV